MSPVNIIYAVSKKKLYEEDRLVRPFVEGFELPYRRWFHWRIYANISRGLSVS